VEDFPDWREEIPEQREVKLKKKEGKSKPLNEPFQ